MLNDCKFTLCCYLMLLITKMCLMLSCTAAVNLARLCLCRCRLNDQHCTRLLMGVFLSLTRLSSAESDSKEIQCKNTSEELCPVLFTQTLTYHMKITAPLMITCYKNKGLWILTFSVSASVIVVWPLPSLYNAMTLWNLLTYRRYMKTIIVAT